MIGRDKAPQVQEAIGEAVRYLTTLRAFIRAAEDGGHLSDSGYWMPDPIFVTAMLDRFMNRPCRRVSICTHP